MATYGIVIEGSYDEAVLRELIIRCLPSEIEIISRPCGGKSQLMKRFIGFLKSFRYEKQGSPIDKALVIRDADNKDPDSLLQEMNNKFTNQNYTFEVKFVIILQSLETWLLADEEAISRVAQTRFGRPVSRVNEDLESIFQPKERLTRILSDAKLTYTAEVAREIARESDLSKLENRCPSFREFRQAVLDC
ncbi:DUF4276 family protein [Desulfobacterota bacterium AH_259_B03_O07]|nr:DUF4276 family protein [Desulfobacterota bacterium AH_259_B03_O07]